MNSQGVGQDLVQSFNSGLGGDLIIIRVLEKKLDEILQVDNFMEIKFSADEIMIVNNLTELRALKLFVKFPDDLKVSRNKIDCFRQIKECAVGVNAGGNIKCSAEGNAEESSEDNISGREENSEGDNVDNYAALIYLTLEFFVLSNPFLEKNITKVYGKNGFMFTVS